MINTQSRDTALLEIIRRGLFLLLCTIHSISVLKKEYTMGYRSDVALALNEKGRTLFNQKLASGNTAAVVRYDVSRLLEHASQHKYDAETNSECWLWQGVKWFTGDPVY